MKDMPKLLLEVVYLSLEKDNTKNMVPKY